MSGNLTPMFKLTAYVAACQTLTFGLLEVTVSELPEESELGLPAECG
jgi:hypothetical protein